jgi:hypothetical protein
MLRCRAILSGRRMSRGGDPTGWRGLARVKCVLARWRTIWTVNSAMYRLVWAGWLRIIDRKILAFPIAKNQNPASEGVDNRSGVLWSALGELAVEPCSGACREAIELYFSTPPERWRAPLTR